MKHGLMTAFYDMWNLAEGPGRKLQSWLILFYFCKIMYSFDQGLETPAMNNTNTMSSVVLDEESESGRGLIRKLK